MKKYIRTLTIYYDTEISSKETPLFRGVILNAMGDDANLLFHNHTDKNTFRYSYPLIQYKRIRGKAAVVCVNEGVDTIGQFIANYDNTVKIGNRVTKLTINKVIPSRILVQTWADPFKYHIQNWLPLNSKNYETFKNITDEEEKKAFLTKILKANILSMLKGLSVILDDELTLEITWLSAPKMLHYKNILMTAFNADFKCNVSIPNNLSIGKSASLGFGTIFLRKKDDTTPDNEPNSDMNKE